MNIYRNLLYLQEMDAESLKSIFNLIHFIQCGLKQELQSITLTLLLNA